MIQISVITPRYKKCKLFVAKTIDLCLSSFFYISFLTILIFSSISAQAQEKNYSEPKIKTALIYNLLHFIDWPSKDLLICIYDPGEDYVSSFNAIPSSTKSGNALNIKFLNESGGPSTQSGCHIIFITDATNNKNLRDILLNAKNNRSVTIGETKQFIKQGGMINFVRRDVNIKFEINASAFKQANLKISSQVLRIADRVYTDSSYE